MSQDLGVTNGAHSAPRNHAEAYRWISCKGCDGEIGIPWGWNEGTANCPQCGAGVQVKGVLLYRPPIQGDTSSVQQIVTPTPSLELNRQAEWVLTWGVSSVVLGWTLLIPLFGLLAYNDASQMAKEERVMVPSKATVGLVLALLFGGGQGLVMILHFCK